MTRLRAEGRRAAARVGIRVGLGIDVHPFAAGRPLILGGVRIDHDRGLLGHSDADVLAHAICDAYLGAMSLPDMGTRFPDTDPRLAGRSSLVFLREVAAEARARGYALVNLDAVLLAEAPRMQPHLEAIRETLAEALGCSSGAVGVKVKRSEGLGSIGRQEGILAQAIVLLGPGPRRRQRAGRRR
jgi:2-C-methyl-D-erythritol 2,4-cyclodiphosphate synthase